MSLYKHYSTQFNGVLKIVGKYHPEIAEGCFFKENNTTYFRNKDNPVNILMIEFIESIGKIPSHKNNALSLDKNANNVQLNWNKFIIFVKNKTYGN